MKFRKPNIYKHLLALGFIYSFGIMLLILVHFIFNEFIYDLDKKINNERVRIEIGKLIIENTNRIESNFYQLFVAKNIANQNIISEETRPHFNAIDNALTVLKNGGTLQVTTPLNLENISEISKEITYKTEKNNYALEMIDLKPKLDNLDKQMGQLLLLVNKREHYFLAKDIPKFSALKDTIYVFGKLISSNFVRFRENANRSYYNGTLNLQNLETEIEITKTNYNIIELIILLLILGLIFVFSFIVARQINRTNKSLVASQLEMKIAKEEIEGTNVELNREINERIIAEDALKNSEERLKHIWNTVQSGIILIDLEDYTIVDCNPAAANMIGSTTEEIIGKRCFTYFRNDLGEVCPFADSEIAYDNSERELLKTNKSILGKILKNATPIELKGKKYLLESFLDISEFKKSEEALRESEERLRVLINSIPDIVCFKDGEGRWLQANDADLELFQLKNVDYFNKTDYELSFFTDPIYKEAFTGCMQSDSIAFEKENISSAEETIPTIEGFNKVYDVIKVPLFNNDGSRKGLVVIGRDITYRKIAENELKESESKYRLLAENSVGFIWKVDMDLNFVYGSPGVFAIHGYSPKEISQKNAKDFFAPDEYLKVLKLIEDEIPKGRKHTGVQFESIAIHKNGNLFPVEVAGKIIFDEDERAVAISGFTKDITERKISEKELVESKEKAENANKMKSIFLAQMSHEIRTPINALVNMASLLRFDFEADADADQIMIFDVIDRAGGRIIRTVDLLLNLSEIQAGTYETSQNKFDVFSDILSVLIAENRKLAENKGVKLGLKSTTTETKLFADSHTVNQIFTQLIDNAIKYTENGEVSVKVLRDKKEKLVVEINDTGIGIGKEYYSKLFESFSQEEMGYTRKFEGNGIGLALVKKYCKLNNAIIEVESEKGVGSTFRVIFNN